MYGINNYEFNSGNINFYHLKLSETPYTRRQLLSSFPIFNKFMEMWDCSLDVLCRILDDIGVTDNQIFDYTIIKNDFLVVENGIHTNRTVRDGLYTRTVTTHYNVYITSNEYANVSLNRVAQKVVVSKYPMLMEAPFLKREKRFKDNINDMPLTLETYIGDIDNFILFDNKITIGDLIKLCTDKGYKESYIEKPIWTVYSKNNDIYFTIDKSKGGHTLEITLKELQNGDWEGIENHHVHSVCLYNDNGEQIKGKWFEGKQKNAPYFNSPIVEAVKKIILANKK